MQQIVSVWSALDARRRLVVTLATLAMFAAILGLSRLASQPSMALLYAGLDPPAAGEVVRALEAQGVAYDIRGGAIFVPRAQRDGLRMTLASEGLPANGSQGYELLDGLSGFGTTSQMFDAAYWRAKEGELARTITASPQIKTARVHIANPASGPFRRDIQPAASVSVTGAGGTIGAGHAQALRYLVASAVAGLTPENVSVIDGTTGTILSGEDEPGPAGENRAAELRHNLLRLLEARVGPGRSVVEVSVETVTEREAIVERRFDPDSRVAISSDTEERSTASSGTEPAAVTVASNLPEGDAGGGGRSQSENSETRERINYEVSETTREVLRSPGAIRRISVAVLVDGMTAVDPATGEAVWRPRPDEELAALRDLVASAVGFDEARGDTITLRSMEFEPVAELAASEPAGLLDKLRIDAMPLIQVGILGLVALALGLFVVRPILKPQPVPAALAPPGGRRAAALPGAAEAGAEPALTGEIDDGEFPAGAMSVISRDGAAGAGDAGGGPDTAADPVARLRRLIEDRREEAVEILRSWLEDEPADDEEPA